MSRIQKRPILTHFLLDNVTVTHQFSSHYQNQKENTCELKSMISNITSNALCIYLTHLFHQTEEIKELCAFQQSITSDWLPWKFAIDAAGELSNSIEDCRQYAVDDAGRLSVVDSLQEALREAIKRARIGDTYDLQAHGRISKAYATRAKYLTYGLTARDDNSELSSLWFLAAGYLQRRLDLKYSFSIMESHCKKSNEHLKAAGLVEKNGVYPGAAKLNERIARHHRYAAALSALGRSHSHDFVTELYQNASSACAVVYAMKEPTYNGSKDPTPPGKLVLLERAASSWQLAAELAGTQATDNSNLRRDPAIQNVVATAKQCAAYAEKVASISAILEKQKDAALKTSNTLKNCKDAPMILLWQGLAEKQQEAIAQAEIDYQRFIDSAIDANTASTSISQAFCTLGVTAEKLRELQMCVTKAQHCKQMATQTLQETGQMSSLATKFWAQAAVFLEDAARICREEIANEEPRRYRELSRTRQFRINSANNCVDIAENVLGGAVELFDKARGAVAGVKNGRDPREAQMWRQAAECLVQKAEISWEEILTCDRTFDAPRSPYYSRDSKAAVEKNRKSKSFSKTAECMHLAYKHRALPDGERISLLYEHTVEYMLLQQKATDPAPMAKLVDQHLALIDVLKESEHMPQSLIDLHTLICKNGQQAHAVSEPEFQQYWSKANDLLQRTLTRGISKNRSQSGGTSARLYACAAREENISDRLCYAAAARACEQAFCAGMDPNADDSDFGEEAEENAKRFALYLNALAAAILSFGDKVSAPPPDITIFLDQVQHQCAEEEDSMTSEAEKHAKYVMLQNKCKCMCAQLCKNGTALDAWNAAQREVNFLLIILHDYANDAYVYHQTGHFSTKISFHVLVVKCHVALAESLPGSIAAIAWKQAVEICQNSASSTVDGNMWYEDAIAEVERAVRAAQTQIVEDA